MNGWNFHRICQFPILTNCRQGLTSCPQDKRFPVISNYNIVKDADNEANNWNIKHICHSAASINQKNKQQNQETAETAGNCGKLRETAGNCGRGEMTSNYANEFASQANSIELVNSLKNIKFRWRHLNWVALICVREPDSILEWPSLNIWNRQKKGAINSSIGLRNPSAGRHPPSAAPIRLRNLVQRHCQQKTPGMQSSEVAQPTGREKPPVLSPPSGWVTRSVDATEFEGQLGAAAALGGCVTRPCSAVQQKTPVRFGRITQPPPRGNPYAK